MTDNARTKRLCHSQEVAESAGEPKDIKYYSQNQNSRSGLKRWKPPLKANKVPNVENVPLTNSASAPKLEDKIGNDTQDTQNNQLVEEMKDISVIEDSTKNEKHELIALNSHEETIQSKEPKPENLNQTVEEPSNQETEVTEENEESKLIIDITEDENTKWELLVNRDTDSESSTETIAWHPYTCEPMDIDEPEDKPVQEKPTSQPKDSSTGFSFQNDVTDSQFISVENAVHTVQTGTQEVKGSNGKSPAQLLKEHIQTVNNLNNSIVRAREIILKLRQNNT